MTKDRMQFEINWFTSQIEGMKRLNVPEYLLKATERYLESLLDDMANKRYIKE